MLFSTISEAQGNLLLYPKRIVFEGAKRSQTISLANTGKDTVRYLVSVVQMKMKEDGSFVTITEPDSGQNFATKYIRFFPRSVVLAPNESQSVKIQLINTAGMPAGEYRSHIYFRAVPIKKPLGEPETRKDTSAISIQLVAVFGISIPIIIRTGVSTTQVNISDASIAWKQDTIASLKLTFKRIGNMSVYGDVVVQHISATGKTTPVSKVMGMALYSPNATRFVTLTLNKNAGVDFHKGKLLISYVTQAELKFAKMAETDLQLK